MLHRVLYIGTICASLSLLLTFQNCARPYNLNLETPSEANDANSDDQEVVVNNGTSMTNNSVLHFKLNYPHAQEVSITGQPECRGDWLPFSEEIAKPWIDGDGLAQVYVRFRNFRKEESACFSVKITVDTTPPVIAFSSAVNAVDRNHNPVFNLNITENVSGLKDLECMVKRKTDLSGSFASCQSQIQFSNLTDGDYVLQVRAMDVAGNPSPVFVHEWTIDSQAPGLMITKQPAVYSAKSQEAFEFLVDSANTITCALDAQGPTNCQSPWIVNPIAEGPHNVVIEAKDLGGNNAKYEYQFLVDRTKPLLNIDSQPPAIDASATAKIMFSSSDGVGSGIDGHRCKLDGGAELACSTSSSHTLSNLSEGPHSVSIFAVDRAGNSSVVSTVNWTVKFSPTVPTMGLVGNWKLDASSGNTVVDSVAGNNGTLTSMQANAWMPSGGKFGGALFINNTNASRVQMGDVLDFAGQAPYSISTWVYRTAGGTNYQSLVSKTTTDANGRQGWTSNICNGCPTANRGIACERFFNGSLQIALDLTGPVPIDQWTHVACTYDGSRVRVYRNGVYAGSSGSSTLGFSIIDHAGPLTLGNSFNTDYHAGLKGRLDEVRIYNRALSAAEVSALFSQ